jgi:Xaa-Pro dipeptidase
MLSTRRKKACEAIEAAGLDGVLFAQGSDFQYLSECTGYFWQRSCMDNIDGACTSKINPEALLFLAKDGTCTIITIPQYKNSFPGQTVIPSYMDQFEDTLARVVTGAQIGIGNDCEKFLKDTLQAVNPAIITRNVEHLFDAMRAIKDDGEIAQMRRLARFTDDAVMYCVKHLHEGMTQWDAENLLMQYGFDHGIQDFSFPPTAGFKTRGTFTAEQMYDFSRDSRLVPGTAIAFDVGYMNQGYCSDWGRTLYYGKAPDFVKRGYEVLNHACGHLVEQIVPNQTNVNECFDMIRSDVEKDGYLEYLRYKDERMLGHQIGIQCHEHPMVNAQTDAILRPGMIFCSEPKMSFPGECYMRVEDMILVTDTGAEFLTHFPRDFFEFNND